MLKLDIRDFQAWSAEFRDFPYSEREVLHAFKQLKQLELIGVAKTEVTIRAKHWDYPKPNGQQTWGLATRNLYLKSGLAILLATFLVGAVKLVPIANSSPSLKTQLQNLKIPNPWNNSNKKS